MRRERWQHQLRRPTASAAVPFPDYDPGSQRCQTDRSGSRQAPRAGAQTAGATQPVVRSMTIVRARIHLAEVKDTARVHKSLTQPGSGAAASRRCRSRRRGRTTACRPPSRVICDREHIEGRDRFLSGWSRPGCLGPTSKAIEVLRELIDRPTSDLNPYLLLAEIYLRKGDHKATAAVYRQILARPELPADVRKQVEAEITRVTDETAR